MSPHAVRKLKMPAPSRKNGRRSSKNCSNADRFSTDGSASTWPKSGLIVASRVRLEPSPYLMSAPADTDCGCVYDDPLGRVSFLVTTYGVTSSRRGVASPWIPVSSPACDTYPCLLRSYNGQLIRAPVRATSRTAMKPNVWLGVLLKRIWLNGILNSATQPSESIAVATSQTASHVASSVTSLYT